jgi:hypothetical protein
MSDFTRALGMSAVVVKGQHRQLWAAQPGTSSGA